MDYCIVFLDYALLFFQNACLLRQCTNWIKSRMLVYSLIYSQNATRSARRIYAPIKEPISKALSCMKTLSPTNLDFFAVTNSGVCFTRYNIIYVDSSRKLIFCWSIALRIHRRCQGTKIGLQNIMEVLCDWSGVLYLHQDTVSYQFWLFYRLRQLLCKSGHPVRPSFRTNM